MTKPTDPRVSQARLEAWANPPSKSVLRRRLATEVGADDLQAMARELLALRADGWRPMSAHDGSTDEVLLWWPYWSNQPTVGHLKHGRWIAENALNEWPTTRDNDYPGPQAFRPLPAPPAEERRQLVTIEEVSGCVDELTGGKSLREHMNKLRGDE